MSKLFSVITVTYNDKNNLEKTIQSVIKQKNKLDDIEYIVIDGDSSDGSSELINKYKNYIDVVVSEPDKGLYDAMNKALKLAKGQYANFINAGDIFAGNDTLLKVKMLMIESNQADLIYGDALETTLDGNTLFKQAYSNKLIWHGMFTHHQSMFYKMSTIKENEIVYNLKYKIAADYAFTYKVVKLSTFIQKIDLPICVFLQGGLSAQHANKGLTEQNTIRKEIGGMQDYQIKLLELFHKLKLFIRSNFSGLYNYMRYRKI